MARSEAKLTNSQSATPASIIRQPVTRNARSDSDVPSGTTPESCPGAQIPKAVANWVINNLRAKISESSSRCEEALTENRENGKSPALIVREKALAQVSDIGAIEKFCDEAIAVNHGLAADFEAGKLAVLNFLKGQVMKLSKGKANPALAGEILGAEVEGLTLATPIRKLSAAIPSV